MEQGPKTQDMSKTVAILFFLLFNILTYSAYGNTTTTDTEDFRTFKQYKGLISCTKTGTQIGNFGQKQCLLYTEHEAIDPQFN
jgi:hypothetical protein